MPALADRHRVIALDLRGFGWSDAPRRGFEKENMALDVLAVMDVLGLEKVKLAGHDWGGWIGFLLCLRAPERFDRYLALNITHPWQSAAKSWRHLWRFWYQWVVIAPGLGYHGHRRGWLTRSALRGGTVDKSVWDEQTLAAFVDNIAEPARSRAAVSLYRTFNFRESIPVGFGRYSDKRLTVPTKILFGTGDRAISYHLLEGAEEHADQIEIELVPDCGHFIIDERPELVADRARAFFA